MANSNRLTVDSGVFDLNDTEDNTQPRQPERQGKTFRSFTRFIRKNTRDTNVQKEQEKSRPEMKEEGYVSHFIPMLPEKKPPFEDSTTTRTTIGKPPASLPLPKNSFLTSTETKYTGLVPEPDAPTVQSFIPKLSDGHLTTKTNVQCKNIQQNTRRGPGERRHVDLELKKLREREYKNLQKLPYFPEVSFENLAEYNLPSNHLLDAYVHDKQKMGMEFGKAIMKIGCNTDSLWLVQIGVKFSSEEGFGSFLSDFMNNSSDELKQCLVDEVTKLFTMRYGSLFHISELWVGYVSRRGSTNNPIDTLVVTTQDPILQRCKVLKFCGLSVEYREKNKFSSEAVALLQHETRNCVSIKLADIATNDLLSKHSNITLLTISGIKSRGFNESKHQIDVTPCVVIYCKVKGIVPFGESIFPETIAGYPVDVREGACSFASNPAGLQLGQKIGPRNNPFTFGTLGGFVNLPESDKIGFITCAHVVCSHDILQRGRVQNYVQNNSIKISDRSISSTESIGSVRKAAFRYGEDTQVSVDAALVEITSRNPKDGEFAIDWSQDREKLRDMGFSDTNKPSFFNGETTTMSSENIRNVLLKVGAATALTVGRVK